MADKNAILESLDGLVREFSWAENEKRTDAHLKIIIDPFFGGESNVFDLNAILDCSKNDYIAFVKKMCESRTDTFTIDAIRIHMDGDTTDTKVEIYAEIHLAE